MAALSKAAQEIEDSFAAYQSRKNVRQAPAWMPESGMTMKGEVIGLKMGTGDYGPYPIIVYRVILSKDENTKPGDVVSVHAFHTILRESMKEKGTQLGSVQWITYDGKRETNESKKARKLKPDTEIKEYHLYDVENDGEQDAVEGVDPGFTF